MDENRLKYFKSLVFMLVVQVCMYGITDRAIAESISSTPSISETVPSTNQHYRNKTIWPNRAAKSLSVPSGWGGSWGDVFFGGGITKPAAYTTKSDGAISFGIGLGNPVKNVGIELVPVVWDVSKFDNLSLDVKIHRYLGDASSVAFGGENLFADKSKTDAGQSYYIVFSHAFQDFHAHDSDLSALHGSVGVGSGRYGEKSKLDIQSGKGRYGTYIFGALAYEVYDSTNIIIEWNGLNLSAGLGFAPYKAIPVGIAFGVADITRNSGDRVRLLCGVGISYKL